MITGVLQVQQAGGDHRTCDREPIPLDIAAEIPETIIPLPRQIRRSSGVIDLDHVGRLAAARIPAQTLTLLQNIRRRPVILSLRCGQDRSRCGKPT